MRRRVRGLSLAELLVVLTIGVILLSIGIPMFAQWVDRSRVESEAKAFQLALVRARSEALGRGLRAVVAPLPGGWAGGWRVFVDGNRDGEYVPDATPDGGLSSGDRELLVHAVASAVPVVAVFSPGWGERIVFLPGGYVRGAGGVELGGRMGFGEGGAARSVCLSALGRVGLVRGEECPA